MPARNNVGFIAISCGYVRIGQMTNFGTGLTFDCPGGSLQVSGHGRSREPIGQKRSFCVPDALVKMGEVA